MTYLAAHAPKVIPTWFMPEMPPKPDQIPFCHNKFGKWSNHPSKELYMKFYDDNCDEWTDENGEVPQSLKDEVAAYIERLIEVDKEIEKWNAKEKVQKIAQWPWFWAKIVNEAPNEQSPIFPQVSRFYKEE